MTIDVRRYVPTEDDHVRGGMDWKLMHRWIAARNVTENQGNDSILSTLHSTVPPPNELACIVHDRKLYNIILAPGKDV